MAYTRPPAPEPLDRAEAFCNSARFLYGEDAFTEVDTARAWLRAHGWGRAAEILDDEALGELTGFREALRAQLAGTADAQAVAVLNDHARATLGPPRWAPGDTAGLPVVAATPTGVLIGELLAVVGVAELAGRRARLKVCTAADCRWVFYDRSPGNNSVWCDMSICGARHKMRTYRTRHAAG